MALYKDEHQIKLVASDLDGTLLLNWVTKPNPKIFELVDRLAQQGVTFMAASGRQHASLRKLFAPVADRISYLCENGALVVHEGKTVAVNTMPHNLAMRIVRAVDEYPGAMAFISLAETSLVQAKDMDLADHLVNITGNDVTVVPNFAHVDQPILKVAYRIAEDLMPASLEHFQQLFSHECNVVTSGTIWTDFTMPGADKGTGLAQFSRASGIAADQMIAFGDEMNDRSMLDYVGHPYLMNSGNPQLRNLNDRMSYCDTVEGELERLLAECTE